MRAQLGDGAAPASARGAAARDPLPCAAGELTNSAVPEMQIAPLSSTAAVGSAKAITAATSSGPVTHTSSWTTDSSV